MCGTEIISKVKGETAMKVVATEKAPKALGPYSQGYVHAGVLDVYKRQVQALCGHRLCWMG